LSWTALSIVKLNEVDTTSSSRIFLKEMFLEMASILGLKKLNDRLKDPSMGDTFSGLFPVDHPRKTIFAINYFTSIGLGALT
jgi:pre-mRNA-splicing factor CWC22